MTELRSGDLRPTGCRETFAQREVGSPSSNGVSGDLRLTGGFGRETFTHRGSHNGVSGDLRPTER